MSDSELTDAEVRALLEQAEAAKDKCEWGNNSHVQVRVFRSETRRLAQSLLATRAELRRLRLRLRQTQDALRWALSNEIVG